MVGEYIFFIGPKNMGSYFELPGYGTVVKLILLNS